MSEAPSWLQPTGTTSSTTAGAAAPASQDWQVAPVNGSTTSAGGAGGLDTSPTTSATNNGGSSNLTDEDPDLPGVILMMRLANLAVAASLIIVSVFQIIRLNGLGVMVIAVYGICGGLLICCLETQLKFLRVMIAVNFGFLFNSIGRFMYYLLLASLCMSYNTIFSRIVAIAFMAVALYNTFVLCRYPSYRKIREQIAEEEDKRIESRISKEVKKQVAKQIMK